MKYKIYTLNHPITNEVRYVGYTKNTLEYRFQEHWRKRSTHSPNSYKCRWLRSLEKEGLKPLIKLVESFETLELALKKEIELIAEYRSIGYKLTNNTDGGEALVGYKITEEVREKLRVAKIGKKRNPHSEETKRKMSLANKGRKMTEEQKAKMKGRIVTKETRQYFSKLYKGKYINEETKMKMSQCRKKEWQEGRRKPTMLGKKMPIGCKSGEKNGFYGKKHSEETKKLISIKKKLNVKHT